jgi:TIR domain-containing protein
MADIFVSYSKQDRVLALKLSTWLEAQGWTTWRDKTVVADDICNENVTELNQAGAVIVIWSAASVGSPHILHEAIAARDARKLLHVKVSGLDGKRIPVSLRDQVVLDAHDLPSVSRAVAGILRGSPAVRQLPLGDAQSVVVAGPRREPRHGLLITRRTRETAQEAIELRASLRRTQLRRAVLLAMAATCLAALTVVVLFGNVLTNAVSSAQSGLTKLLAFLN